MTARALPRTGSGLIPALIAAPIAVAVGLTAGAVHPLAPVAAVLGGALVIACLRSPFLCLLIFTALLYTRAMDFLPALAPFNLARLAALGALGLTFANKALGRDLSWAYSRQNRWMAALVLGVLLSCPKSSMPVWSMTVFKDLFVKIAILYVLILNLVDDERRAVVLQTVLAACTSFLGGYAIYAKYAGLATIEGSRAGAAGLLGDPNDLALALLTTMPFLVLAVRYTRGLKRLGFALMLTCGFMGLIFTQSRGGMLAFCAGMYMLFRTRINRGVLIVGVAGALLGMAAMAGVSSRATVATHGKSIDASAQNRLDAWHAALRIFRHKPLLGVGFDTFPMNYPNYAVNAISYRMVHTHNTWLQVLAETGLAGFVPFMVLLWLTVQAGRRVERATGPPGVARAMRESQLSNFMALLAAAFFLSQAWNWFLYVQIGLLASLDRVVEARLKEEEDAAEGAVLCGDEAGGDQDGPRDLVVAGSRGLRGPRVVHRAASKPARPGRRVLRHPPGS